MSSSSDGGRARGSWMMRLQALRLARQSTIPTVSGAILGDGLLEELAAEVRPVRINEHQLRIRRLPEKEVRQADLAARADEQVGVRNAAGVQLSTKELGRDLGRVQKTLGRLLGETPGRFSDLDSGSIVEGDNKREPIVGHGERFRLLNQLEQIG